MMISPRRSRRKTNVLEDVSSIFSVSFFNAMFHKPGYLETMFELLWILFICGMYGFLLPQAVIWSLVFSSAQYWSLFVGHGATFYQYSIYILEVHPVHHTGPVLVSFVSMYYVCGPPGSTNIIKWISI